MLVDIRGHKDQLQVYLHNGQIDACFHELSNKLADIRDLKIEAIYLFVEHNMTNEQLLMLFQLVNQMGMCIASIQYVHQYDVIQTLHEIGVGKYTFDHDVLLLSDVSMYTQITMYHGNLYVFGKVSGEIEMYSKQSKLYAVEVDRLQLKMNDMPWQYIHHKNHCILSYEKRKENRIWQEQL